MFRGLLEDFKWRSKCVVLLELEELWNWLREVKLEVDNGGPWATVLTYSSSKFVSSSCSSLLKYKERLLDEIGRTYALRGWFVPSELQFIIDTSWAEKSDLDSSSY